MNAHEDAARARKAGRIAATLARLGLSAEQVLALDGEGRRIVERAAGVKRGSDETWSLVAEMVRPAKFVGDPFKGVAP